MLISSKVPLRLSVGNSFISPERAFVEKLPPMLGWRFVGAWIALIAGGWAGVLAIAWGVMLFGDAVAKWVA